MPISKSKARSQSATVSGQVLTTNSRFLKNIDIIPIGLPGRPAPLPEPPSAAPTLSFPDPPLRDWKFDIAIKSKDPFLIRGNLATGECDHRHETGRHRIASALQGQVRLENFDATLPFSTLTIRLGFLYFDPDDPLNPRIELQGDIADPGLHDPRFRLRNGEGAAGDFQQRAAAPAGGNYFASRHRQ